MSSAAEKAFQQGESQHTTGEVQSRDDSNQAILERGEGPIATPEDLQPKATGKQKSAAEQAFEDGAATTTEPQEAGFEQAVQTTPYDQLNDLHKKRLESITDPHDISRIPKHQPLTEEQSTALYEHERSLPWNEGLRTSEDWYNLGAGVIETGKNVAKGAAKVAYNVLDPTGNQGWQSVKDFMSPVAELPEKTAYLAEKLYEGGMDWKDRLSESMGLQDKSKSYENWKTRRLVDQIQAEEAVKTPSIYGRILKSEPVVSTLAAVALNTLPDTKTIMEQDGLNEQQANEKRQAMARQIAEQQVAEQASKEKAADKEIAEAGTFLTGPLGLGEMGAVSLLGEAGAGVASKAIQTLKMAGKSENEINAMLAAEQQAQREKALESLQKAQQPTWIGKTAGKTAEAIDAAAKSIEKFQGETPQFVKDITPMIGGGIAGYELGGENKGQGAILGALLGKAGSPVVKLGKYALKAPALIRDIDEARAIAAGGTRGTFETLAGFPEVSESAAKLLRYGGKNLDNILENSLEYGKAGIHGTALALATGALDSASPEEMNNMLGSGLFYIVGGRAAQHVLGKLTGVDPVVEARTRRQQAVDDLKTYRDLDPESQKTLDSVTSWGNVIQQREQKLNETQQAYADAVARGAKNAEELGKSVVVQQKAISMLKRANVQTRNEYGRLFVRELTNLNQLTNGSLRAGQNNVGFHILTPDQIFAKFRQDPANAAATDQEIRDAAEQRGFYSTPEGAVEYQAGMGMEAPKSKMIFDRTKPSIVINADHLKARMLIDGESAAEALRHETGHHIRNIPEFRDMNKDAEALLFSQDIKDPSGNVVTTTSGQYSDKDLVDMFNKNYMKGKTPDQVEQLAKLGGLWDYSRGALNEPAVAEYMRDEIIADLNAETISRHLGKDLDSGTLHLLDLARMKTKKNILDRALIKFAGLGGKGDARSELTGAEYTPEVLAANRNAMRALQSLQGEVSEAVKAPDAPKISRAEMMKNRALMNRYGKDSGMFKTKVQAQIFDGNGNPVGAPIDIANPNASEGSWQNKDGAVRQLNGYGQQPDEVAGIEIPEGGSLVVGRQIVMQPDGKTPVLLTPKESKALQKSRGQIIRQALDTPDYGAPNRFEPTGDPDGTWRGTFTPLQIEAIKNLPESIIPKSIKENMLKINDAIVRGDGSRLLVDYAAVMDDNGRYKPYAAKIYDVAPIGMHLSKDGHILSTNISVGRMFDKLNKWSERMPARLAPWGGSKEAFFKEFTEKYLQNWQNGVAGETGLAGTHEEALAKKNIFNDFLNLATKDTAPLNPDRTKTPRRRGDVRGKDIDRTIMSMRLDHMAELIDNEGAPKVPVSYQKAKFNMMPAEPVVEQAKPEERKPSAIDLGITAARSPESMPFGAQYVAPQQQRRSDLFFMPASAEIREKGSKQHLEFWNRELENSGIKEKPTTMGALDAFIHKYIQEKYYVNEGGPSEDIFPQVNPEKIKNYYQKVVRGATAEQALNFPENWRRVRNMSDEEFNNFFTENRVNEITKSRVETLSKSANYLLGEMRNPKYREAGEIIDYIHVLDEEGEVEKASDLRDQLEEKWSMSLPQIEHAVDRFETQGDYTPAEVAAILDASAKVRVRTGKDENGNMVPVKQKITNGNEVVPNEVSGATASRIAEYMRQGMGSEEAYTKGVFDTMKARAGQRGTYTGWKKYDQSDDMGEAEKLNADVSGTNWCTGGAVSTAHGHLSGGDFYVYFDEGEPQIAIRTEDGKIAEVRGRGEGQNITTPAYDQAAEEFIRSGEGPQGGAEYLSDREFRKMAVEVMKEGKLPESAYRYYDQNGNFTAPKPKMSYKSEFEPEYLEAFKKYAPKPEDIFDEKTGTLNSSYIYDWETSNQIKHIKGDLLGTKSVRVDDQSIDMPLLEKVDGGIIANKASILKLPNLKSCDYIYAQDAYDVEIRNLENCNSIQVSEANSLIAPKLKEVSRVIVADQATTIDLSGLIRCKDIRAGQVMDQAKVVKLPNLEECDGIHLNIGYGGYVELPKLQKSDSVWISTSDKNTGEVYLPKLKTSERLVIRAGEVHIPEYYPSTFKTGKRATSYISIPEAKLIESPKETLKIRAQNDGPVEGFTFIDSETGKVYRTKATTDYGDLVRALAGQPAYLSGVAYPPEQVLAFLEVETQASRDRKAREPEMITAATYTDPETFITTKGKSHQEANPNAPDEQSARETYEYGFETNKGRNVDREEAYKIAKDAGQLKEPTEDSILNHARGVLHSDMVNYEGGKSGIAFMPKSEEPDITEDGHVMPKTMDKPFAFTPKIAINFMPATPQVDLENFLDRPIIALAADRMGIGQAYVGPTGAKQPLSMPSQGGAGFSTLYRDEEHNPIWAFSTEQAAKNFLKRINDVAELYKTDSVLVAPTLLAADNHLKNQTGQLGYVEAMEAALKAKMIKPSALNAQINEIIKRISESESPKARQATKRLEGISTFKEFADAVRKQSFNFADAEWIMKKAAQKKLPITAKELDQMGLLPSQIAKDLAHEGYYELPNFSVVSLFEVPKGQKPEKGMYHNAYPYIVRGKSIGYLKNIINLAQATKEPKVFTSSGQITAQPLMTVMPIIDQVLAKKALDTLKAYTPPSN
jgi:hypothetical protein